jgi:predicted ATP-grasp superfamily ATP-dependent carboligase
MRIFAYEYLSSGVAANASARSSLHAEGRAMLSALREDLSRCPGVQVSTLRVQPAAEEDAFRDLAAAADWSWLIAPEFDGILTQRSRWVEEVGGRLLGSSPQAIDATADKLLLSRFWASRNVSTPPTEKGTYPLVCKPRFGAGSQATFLVHDEEELAQAQRQAHAEDWNGELMLQRYVPGLAASVAFLCGGGKRRSLPAVEQRLSRDGRFRYRGGRLPLPENLDRRARRLAERAVEGIEGLHGWFGVDLILADAEDGSGDAAIEINPRLTTSYLGLRRSARFNLAEALLAMIRGSPIPRWEWGNDALDFEAG